MEILRLINVKKFYKLSYNKRFQALKDISLSFKNGEQVAIIGESGSGKSTLMNLIGGLDSDFEGKLLVEGKNIGDFTQKELDEYRKKRIGFVFQNCHLIAHLSVLDNVTIVLTLSNVSKKERVRRAIDALKSVGLEKHIHKKPNQLSGGEKQRVAIARALINDPDIILADEPTGALDSQTTEHILGIIRNIAKKGKLVIIVTHSQKVALYSDRVIKILDGNVIADMKVTDNVGNEIDVKKAKKGKRNLSFLSSVRLAANNMKQKLKRNILVALGVSIGITSVILMLSLGDGLKTYLKNMIDSFMNPLVVEASMPIRTDPNDMKQAMKALMREKVPFQQKNIDQLSGLEGVRAVEKGFSIVSVTGANSLVCGDKGSAIMMINSMSSAITDKNIKQGAMPGQNQILINEYAAKKLGGNVIGKTTKLNVEFNKKMISGDFVVSGIYTAGNNNLVSEAAEMVFINYGDLESMVNKAEMQLEPTVMYLITDSGKAASKIKARILAMGYLGSIQEIMGDQMFIILNIITVVLTGIAAISLLVSSIMILIVLFIGVVERTKEIGLLRAIGARSKDIKRIFVSEAFLIGLASGIIGVLSAYAVAIGVNNVAMRKFNIQVLNITRVYVMVGITVSVVASIVAGLLPANKAAKLDPVKSLRTE